MTTVADKSRGAPVLWIALVLLAACILGTLWVVAVSAFKGADELPAVYHTEGAAADADLQALSAAKQQGIEANLKIAGRRVEIELAATSGVAAPIERATLRLTHATLDAQDATVDLDRHGGQLVGTLALPLATGSWWAELRPTSADWLLRWRIAVKGGQLVAGRS